MRLLGCALGVLLAVSTQVSAGTIDIAGQLKHLQTIFDQSIAKLEQSAASANGEGLREYRASLSTQLTAEKRKGDLEGVTAVNAELARLKAEKGVPTADEPNLHPSVILARTEYRRSVERAVGENRKRIIDLADMYEARLTDLQKRAVMANQLDDARAVKTESERAANHPAVTAARFAAAVDVTAGPKPQDPSDTGPGEAEKAATKTYSFKKQVPAKGGMTGSWTTIPFNVSTGDKIEIKAYGSWQCTGERAPCGPAGYPSSRYGYSWRRTGTQDAASNYGSLIYRIGKSGPMKQVGTGASFTADRDGMIEFDVNIISDRKYRRACSGDVTVEMTVTRRLD